MMHGKAIGKLGIGEIAKVSKGNAIRVEGGGGGGCYSTSYELPPPARTKRADAHWVMAYFHKTQSFMKNEGQQKCLDKALLLK